MKRCFAKHILLSCLSTCLQCINYSTHLFTIHHPNLSAGSLNSTTSVLFELYVFLRRWRLHLICSAFVVGMQNMVFDDAVELLCWVLVVLHAEIRKPVVGGVHSLMYHNHCKSNPWSIETMQLNKLGSAICAYRAARRSIRVLRFVL